jgi:hypothetical protein
MITIKTLKHTNEYVLNDKDMELIENLCIRLQVLDAFEISNLDI